MKNREPWNFCETPKEKCTMNYCDDNGCQNRKRYYVEGNDLITDVVVPNGTLCKCVVKYYKQRVFNNDWNTCEKCGLSKLA